MIYMYAGCAHIYIYMHGLMYVCQKECVCLDTCICVDATMSNSIQGVGLFVFVSVNLLLSDFILSYL